MTGTATAPATPPELRGYCAPPALAELIRDLYLEERTGTLVISRSGVEKRIVLDRGMIVAATSSLEDERLAPFLAARGVIREDEALALRGLDDRRAAEALLGRSQITAENLTRAAHELAQQVLTAVFRWEELEYRFLEGESSAWPIATNVLISLELIVRAMRSMAGFEPLRQAMLRQDRAVRLADDLYVPLDQLSLTPIEGFLVSRVDGQTRPRDILAQLPPTEEEAAARFLFGLLILGLAQFTPPVGPGLLSCSFLLRGDEEKRRREETEKDQIAALYRMACSGDATALLGVHEGSTQEEVKAAYEQKKERIDPGRFLRRVQIEMKEELQIIEASLLEAFLAFRGKALEGLRPQAAAGKQPALDFEVMAKRKELSKTATQSKQDEDRMLAEQYFTKAREYWKMGDMFSCIRYCEFARSHHESDAAVHSLLGQALARNPDHRWQRRAETAFVRATDLEPFNANHWVQLGEFYCQNKLFAKARKQFEMALQILPSHAQAKQALRDLPATKR